MADKKDAPRSHYLIVFKVEGHSTYRVLTGAFVDTLERHIEASVKHPVVIEKKVYHIDALTGEVKPLE